MLELVDRLVSETSVHMDVWVRLPLRAQNVDSPHKRSCIGFVHPVVWNKLYGDSHLRHNTKYSLNPMLPQNKHNFLVNIVTALSLIALVLSVGSLTARLYLQNPAIFFTSEINHPWPSANQVPQPQINPPSQIAFETSLQKQTPQISPNQTSNITETDLWQALANYRTAHSRNTLTREEPLCAYARQRVVEHQERLKNIQEGESPLDNHSGFQRDADSGSIFSDTGFSSVAEVLAFLPDAQNSTQIIEWGWDSSPAHREGLLSNDFTHACVVGTAPFYVGILGRR